MAIYIELLRSFWLRIVLVFADYDCM